MGKIAVDKIINGLITRKVCVMHLDSLKIKNFRILEDVTIEKLGHVNLIVGKNNSGKSTVLEALLLFATGFHSESVKFANSIKNSDRFFSKNSSNKESISIENLLNSKNKTKLTENKVYIGESNNFLEFGYLDESEMEESTYFELYCDTPYNHFNDTKNGSTIRVISNFGLSIDENDRTQGHWKEEFPCGYVSTNPLNIIQLAMEWDNIALTDNEELVLDMLKLIDSNIKRFAFLTHDNSNIRVPFALLDDNSRIPLHQMGDGVLRLLLIIMKVIKARDGFLLIDEFENGLHYSVQPKVWELIFELAHRFNIQVFATTHSWDCIESFAQVAKDRTDIEGLLFRMGHSVRKSDKGKLIATVFDEDDLYNLTKMNIEVR